MGGAKLGLSEEEMQEIVDKWRESSPRIVQMWWDLGKAAMRSTARRCHTETGYKGVSFDFDAGVLFMNLPSGRRLAYWGAKIGDSRNIKGKKALFYMGVDQQKKTWVQVETYGPKLVENCWASGTLILTDSGWKPIAYITCDDLLWDGYEWVKHEGLICRGSKKVMLMNGVLATSTHSVRTNRGWTYVKDCNGLYGYPVQLPDRYGYQFRENTLWKNKMECEMPVRKRVRDTDNQPADSNEKEEADLLRLPKEEIHFDGEYDTRGIGYKAIRGMALDGTEMHGADTPRMEELRRPRDNRVRQMAAQLRELLVGYVRELQAWAGSGSKRQRSRVLAGELPLGEQNGKQPEPEDKSHDKHSVGRDDSSRGGGPERNQQINDVLSCITRGAGKLSVCDTGLTEPVYDLINAGPRHQYVVLTDTGPIIAHNCVQATARDCLRDAMLRLDAAGFDIRAHVHDECIVTEPVDSGRTVEDMSEIMGQPISWAPGLLLRADGYEGNYYFKD